VGLSGIDVDDLRIRIDQIPEPSQSLSFPAGKLDFFSRTKIPRCGRKHFTVRLDLSANENWRLRRIGNDDSSTSGDDRARHRFANGGVVQELRFCH
jgi:hypothetical protein